MDVCQTRQLPTIAYETPGQASSSPATAAELIAAAYDGLEVPGEVLVTTPGVLAEIRRTLIDLSELWNDNVGVAATVNRLVRALCDQLGPTVMLWDLLYAADPAPELLDEQLTPIRVALAIR